MEGDLSQVVPIAAVVAAGVYAVYSDAFLRRCRYCQKIMLFGKHRSCMIRVRQREERHLFQWFEKRRAEYLAGGGDPARLEEYCRELARKYFVSEKVIAGLLTRSQAR